MEIFKDTNYKSLLFLGLCFRLSVLLSKHLFYLYCWNPRVE